jgi:GTP-binding protein EngB required for normal cell division
MVFLYDANCNWHTSRLSVTPSASSIIHPSLPLSHLDLCLAHYGLPTKSTCSVGSPSIGDALLAVLMSGSSATTPRRVLIVGSSGHGKSSVIKLLTGNQAIVTSSGAVGCTFECKEWRTDDGKWVFIDTAGLNEGKHGTVDGKIAAKKLITFIKENQAGFSLIVLVRCKGRILVTDEKNYELFYKVLCQEKIKLMMIITNCEMDNPIDVWWQQNEAEFIGTYRMKIAGCVSVNSADADTIAAQDPDFQAKLHLKKQKSKDDIFCVMKRLALDNPIPIFMGSDWMAIFRRMWNVFVHFIGMPSWEIIKHTAISETLKFFGFTQPEIDAFLTPELLSPRSA